jgi:GNAT superfamily N-acetyltransferase
MSFNSTAFHTPFASVLENPSATLLMAECEGQVVAYLLGYKHTTFWIGAGVWWVEEFCVDAEHRRRGIGRALVTHFEELVRNDGARLVCLVTGNWKKFYQAMGYGERAVYLRKELHPQPLRVCHSGKLPT